MTKQIKYQKHEKWNEHSVTVKKITERETNWEQVTLSTCLT